jgi:bla regulator protein BlaR1
METIDGIVSALTGSESVLIAAAYIAKSTLLLAAALLAQRLWPRAAPALKHVVLRSALLGVWLLALLLPVSFLWPTATPVLQIPVWSLTIPAATTFDTGLTSGLQAPMRIAVWLAVAWLGGFLFFGARYLLSMIRIRRIAATALTIDNGHVHESIPRLAADLGLRHPVRALITPGVDTPIVWGLRRPAVILPEASSQWSSTQLDMVLRHELAHVKRHDILWLNLASAATVLNWFNPLIWVFRRSLRQAGEYACDDYVLSAGVAGPDYATHLLQTAVEAGRGHRLVSPEVVPGGNFFLEERIMSVLSNHKRILAPRNWLGRSLTGLTIVLALALAVLSIEASAGDESAPKPAAKTDSAKAADLPGIDDFVPVDSVAEMLYYESPLYPKTAEQAGIEGTVWIKTLVLVDGTVGNSIVYKTSGQKVLDESALQAASKCKFKPAIREGKSVACWVTYKVTFALEKGAKGK